MGISFSDNTNKTGIVEQTRDKARVDSTHWATSKIVNSCNNWINHIFTRGKILDRRFQLDDTNHTTLPEGTIDLIANQDTYSFLTDQQGNRITNLTRIDIMDSTGLYRQLIPIDMAQLGGIAIEEWNKTAGLPIYYDKIADNIIRLYPKPATTVVNGIKYFFQRAPHYFVATDTTLQPGVADDLHEGFIIKSAFDAADTLGLSTLNSLTRQLAAQEQVIDDYFSSRETDEPNIIIPRYHRPR